MHSIFHKVRDILRFRWSENFSHQDRDHGHMDKYKNWPIARAIRRYISWYFGHISAREICSIRSLEADLADVAAVAQDEGEPGEIA